MKCGKINGNEKCFICEDGYKPNADGTGCTKVTTSQCTSYVYGTCRRCESDYYSHNGVCNDKCENIADSEGWGDCTITGLLHHCDIDKLYSYDESEEKCVQKDQVTVVSSNSIVGWNEWFDTFNLII